MRVTTQLLRSCARRPLNSIEYVDLSHLSLVTIDRLDLCPKLATVILQGNRIECIPNSISSCKQLWKIDLSNNHVQNLDGLSKFASIGTLILSNNNLSWRELEKIRHIHILNLSLHGNAQLEKDPYYRLHVIDCLPHVWTLDGRIITSAERNQVEQFFIDSSQSNKPVRHKLPRNQFKTTSVKNIYLTGSFGTRTDQMMRKFPLKEVLNIDVDKRRLVYLAFNMQQDMNLENKYINKSKSTSTTNLLENLLEARNMEREQCNMLFLLLVASLEFAIPAIVIQQTLDVARLGNIGKVHSMDLFMLPREARCHIVALLLSAVKIDRDQKIDGSLYDRLYLCLYDLISDLVKLADGDNIMKYKEVRKNPKSRKSLHRSLLASEVVQLLCIVPIFFDFVGREAGLMDLVVVATKDPNLASEIAWKVQNSWEDPEIIYQEIADCILQRINENNAKTNTQLEKMNESSADTLHKDHHHVYTTYKKLTRASQRPLSSIGYTQMENRVRDNSAAKRTARAASAIGIRQEKQLPKKPGLADRVFLGSQSSGRIVSLPECNLCLVYVDAEPGLRFMQADYKKPVQFDHQFVYIDSNQLTWDAKNRMWKLDSKLKGKMIGKIGVESRKTVDDSINRPPSRPFRPMPSKMPFLSEIIKHNLNLHISVPAVDRSPDEEYSPRSQTAKVVITDHVRTIVRECLQEAERTLGVSNAEEGKAAEEDIIVADLVSNITKLAVDEDQDGFEQPHNEAVVIDTGQEVEREYVEVPQQGEEQLYRRGESDGEESVDQEFNYHHIKNIEFQKSKSSPPRQRTRPATSFHRREHDIYDMVSATENARISAWKSPEAIKKAGTHQIPLSIMASHSHSLADFPPQRPPSPSSSESLTVKLTDNWLANGRDLSAEGKIRREEHSPGWMQDMPPTRRPRSCPPRRPMSSGKKTTGTEDTERSLSMMPMQSHWMKPTNYKRFAAYMPLNCMYKLHSAGPSTYKRS